MRSLSKSELDRVHGGLLLNRSDTRVATIKPDAGFNPPSQFGGIGSSGTIQWTNWTDNGSSASGGVSGSSSVNIFDLPTADVPAGDDGITFQIGLTSGYGTLSFSTDGDNFTPLDVVQGKQQANQNQITFNWNDQFDIDGVHVSVDFGVQAHAGTDGHVSNPAIGGNAEFTW